jgi:putative phosphoribosyl transferase
VSAAFQDRADAGRQLAESLREYAGRPGLIVLGLPRGGVPVAFEVARALDAPLDVFVVRKLGVPGHEELAMGAIASGGVRVLNERVVEELELGDEVIASVTAAEQRELERRELALRGGQAGEPLAGRRVILVDDGLATGASMRAAVIALRAQDVAELVVAVPIAAPEVCASFEDDVDAIVCAHTPEPFHAVGFWYDDFSQTTDDEVRELLEARSSAASEGTLKPPEEDTWRVGSRRRS